MRVSEALADRAIIVKAAWETFEETVTGLVNHLVATGLLARSLAEVAVGRICEREAIASTAMVDIGVSIPHARLDGITGIIAALAVSPRAVYQVTAGLPISIVALVLSSPQLTGEHLTFLSAISMLLQSERIRTQLRNAAGPDEVLRLIRENEGARG
jgi:mannitol/fructose-specific phosphotransferase system IIA component (Ntr-type)